MPQHPGKSDAARKAANARKAAAKKKASLLRIAAKKKALASSLRPLPKRKKTSKKVIS